MRACEDSVYQAPGAQESLGTRLLRGPGYEATVILRAGVKGICAPGDLCTLAIPDRRLDAPDLMSGSHITGHDAKLLGISDPGDLCTLVLSSPSQTVTTFQAIDITEYSSLGVVL